MQTVEAAISANFKQKNRMIDKIRYLIGGSFKNKKLAILGLAFKSNTDDIRESSAINMVEAIINNGGTVNAYDPIANREMKKIFPSIEYFNKWEDACNDADAAVIMTEWNEFRAMNLPLLKSLLLNPIILDTRNILSPKKLLKLNFKFDNVGRKFT